MHIESYPKIYALGHRYLADLLDGDVVVQEKVDGSQFTFGVKDGVLHCYSKNTEIDIENPEKMFATAVATVKAVHKRRDLGDGWIYRGEAFNSPRHNVLRYDRMPEGGIVLFDVQRPADIGDASVYDDEPSAVGLYAQAYGMEQVPTIYTGPGAAITKAMLDEWLTRESCLGGCKVEGVVIKNYSRFGLDKKTLMGKYVRAEFKEQHRAATAPKSSCVETLIETYRCDARRRKAVQHIRDEGRLQDDPRDIPTLLKELSRDLIDEEGEAIKDCLFNHYKKEIIKGVSRGFAEWYKDQLAARQFEEGTQ